MIYFDASKVFALLLSCPRLDPFVTTQPSSDVVYIHTGCCYRKTYKAHVKKFGIDMLLPCVMAMDKTHIGMAGQLKMEPTTISHGLSTHIMRRLPSAMHILGYISQSTPPTSHRVQMLIPSSIIFYSVELVNDVVLFKSRPTYENGSWATLLLNETHIQIHFVILKESGFLRLQNIGFK
jgi:hypothetical protein